MRGIGATPSDAMQPACIGMRHRGPRPSGGRANAHPV